MSTTVLHGKAPLRAHEAAPQEAPASRHGYLVAIAVLAPLCMPAGPGQTAALDFVNVVALAAAAFMLLVPGTRLRVPLLAPTALILLGSLLALSQAPSVRLGLLALAQDVYLFAWFVLVVNLLRDESDLRVLMSAWTATAVVVSIVALVQIVLHDHSLAGFLGSRGFRPSGSLYNPNMLADYMVTSLFIAGAALVRRSWLLRFATAAVLMAGLLSTKSNGGMAALGAGLVVWVVVRAVTRRVPLQVMAATALLVLAVGGLGVWLNAEWGVGESALTAFRQHTFAGRLEHSSESRLKIWDQLQRSYAHSPMGIGPGNSGAITLGIADRERPDSFQSKEAHSDYLAYAIERGPLGVIGLLWWTCAGFAAVAAWAGAADALRREAAGRNATGGKGPVQPPARAHTRKERKDAVPSLEARADQAGAWTAAMAAVLTASAMHSTVIEKLHFRHFWLVLAMVCGSALIASERRSAAAVDEAVPGAQPASTSLPSRTGAAALSRGPRPKEVCA